MNATVIAYDSSVIGTIPVDVPLYAHVPGVDPVLVGAVTTHVEVHVEPSAPATTAAALPDVTAYECAQRAAATLERAASVPGDFAVALARIAAGWRDLGCALATVGGLNKPEPEA